jgi:hypothetical protein
MKLKSPNLDDRNFKQLVDEAKLIIASKCPQWTDLTPGDPGIVLLELFAHLTETMIYRLNRLPEKAYVEFLRLIGVKLNPPVAAAARLRFTLSKVQDKPVEIPKGTRVTLGRSGGEPAPVFVVLQNAAIPAGKTQVEVTAYHCELVVAEKVGEGTGLPGFSVSVRRPPIVAATSDDLELIVGVEAEPEELTGRVRALEDDGKAYVVWRESENFSNLQGRQLVYIADRVAGTITFAPAVQSKDQDGNLIPTPQALAAVPKAGKEIKVWYCSGGGPGGNVAANTLTTLKDPIAGVTVTNPEAAAGGRVAETVENCTRCSARLPPATLSCWLNAVPDRWPLRAQSPAPKPSLRQRSGCMPFPAQSKCCWFRLFRKSSVRAASSPKRTCRRIKLKTRWQIFVNRLGSDGRWAQPAWSIGCATKTCASRRGRWSIAAKTRKP